MAHDSTTYTTHHDFEKPAHESEDWHIPLNDNYDTLDTKLIIRDTMASRPSSPSDDVLFLATDDDVLQRYETDTSTWITHAGRGVRDLLTPTRSGDGA